MARTRAQIKALVEAHVGRQKSSLENALCDTALRIALLKHHFKDAQSEPADLAITASSTYVTISAISNLCHIVSARIVETSGVKNKELKLKARTWWDSHVVNPEDNMQGWPEHGLREGTKLTLDRPADSGLSLRLRVTTFQTFTGDSSVCPIEVLDVFVEHYVTAILYKSLTNFASYREWIRAALGPQWERDNVPGGLLLSAINSDMHGDIAEHLEAGRDDLLSTDSNGVAIKNLIDEHDDYGNTRWWK